MQDSIRRKWFAIILLALMTAPGALAQANVAGKVTKVVQSATGDGKTLKVNDPVKQGEVLKTNDKGRLRITLADGSTLTLGGKSTLKLTTLDQTSRQTSLDLAAGRLRSKVTALAGAGQKYEVRTAVAVAGVIGTDFTVVANPDGSATIYCYSGQVQVTSAVGTGVVTLGPGQAVTISPTQLGAPFKFDTNTDLIGEKFTQNGSAAISGSQIAAITAGAAGGAVGGVVTTTNTSPSGSFTPTCPPNSVLTNKVTCSPILGRARPLSAAASHPLLTSSTSSLWGPRSSLLSVQPRRLSVPAFSGRNWFSPAPAPGLSVHFATHFTPNWLPHVHMSKPVVKGGGIVLQHFHASAPIRTAHAGRPHR